MTKNWSTAVKLGEVLRHRKEFVIIDDLKSYRRPRVQLHAQGIVLRDDIPGALIKTKQQQVCNAGEFLVAEIDAKVGAFGIVPASLDGSIVSSHYFLFTIDDAKLDRKFLDYFIRTPMFREQVEAQGSTNYAAIKPSHVLNYEIPLPTLPEQQRIVARIERLSAKIEEARGLRKGAMEEAEALLLSVLHRLAKTLNPKGRLGDVLSKPPRNGWSARCDNAENGIPVLSLGAVTGFRYRATEFKRTSLNAPKDGHFWLKVGDVLITRSNTPDLVGHAAIYDGSPTACIYPDLMMRLEFKESAVESRFVWYWLQSPSAREFIGQNSKGTSPTMKKISQGVVMAIPFPSSLKVNEQRQIVAYLDALREQTDALKILQNETSTGLRALMPAILDKAFRGEL
jgi:type I restriction enzyme, S subunit